VSDKKILRIRLDTADYRLESLDDHYRNLGGRGLTASIIAREVPPQCDPLGPENKLVIAAGLLAGTAVPNSGRLSIGAKSPLTGGIKEANAGGSAAQKLARLDIQAIVLEGRAKDLVSIEIRKTEVRINSAIDLSMMGNDECMGHFRRKAGDGVGLISIGPAGEMGLKAAAVAVSSPDFLPRMAARGGLGAVMGAKNVKALVIDDGEGAAVEIKDPGLFKAAVKAYTKGITGHPLSEGLRAFGTPLLVGLINEMGTLATKNYSLGQFEGAEKISGEALAELLKSRPKAQTAHACMKGCVISCSNVCTDEAGRTVVSGLEFETLALMGSNCLIDDLSTIAAMNGICNDIGVDTMDVGAAIAVAMEAGKLTWGDGARALELVREIPEGTDLGRLIGNGAQATGEALGVARIPCVKGQSLAGYDPRGLKGTGVTYATSPMGADHTCGNALPSPANPDYDHTAAQGQGPVSQFLQRYFAAIDSLGLCLFAAIAPLDMPELTQHLIDCVRLVLDDTLGEDYLLRLGAMVLSEERKFNITAGMTAADDRLPEFFTQEALPPSGLTFDVGEAELDAVHD
jgi:aldehyde:ferredoxin oxidoreductase